jgi:hypothetical protein
MTRVNQDGASSRDVESCFDCTSLVMASSSFAQQVRVISGDVEHVYGPGGELLDDAEQRARNQRASERMQAEKQLAIQRRQFDIETSVSSFRRRLSPTAQTIPILPCWTHTAAGGTAAVSSDRPEASSADQAQDRHLAENRWFAQDGRLATMTLEWAIQELQACHSM